MRFVNTHTFDCCVSRLIFMDYSKSAFCLMLDKCINDNWIMTSCNFVHTSRRFRGTYCLHYKSTFLMDRGGSSETSLNICKIRRRHTPDDVFRVTAVTSDLTNIYFFSSCK